jgi:hypothetical protein
MVVGGDGTQGNWERRRRFELGRKMTTNAPLVNLPHHGSRLDCTPSVLSRLFSADGLRMAFTSANGVSHPDQEVISWLEVNGILPYCTNLIPACGAMLFTIERRTEYEPRLSRWLAEVEYNKALVQTCQGDIEIKISSSGERTVTTETGNSCGYRGDFAPFL